MVHSKKRQPRVLAAVRFLLENGSKTEETGQNGFVENQLHKPVFAAAEYGYFDAVKLLLEHGANESYYRAYSLFVVSAKAGNVEMAEYFFERDLKALVDSDDGSRVLSSKLDAEYKAALVQAAEKGPVKLLEMLVRRGLEEQLIRLPQEDHVGPENSSMLKDPQHCAMAQGNEDSLEALYRLGYQPVDPLLSSEAEDWRDGDLPEKRSRIVRGAFGYMKEKAYQREISFEPVKWVQ